MNKIYKLTEQENSRQQATINLIASENYPSPKVLDLLGSIWNDKYAEGYPGKRYYGGNILADELEEFVQQKSLEVFDSTGEYGVNVQVLSGSPANAMVFLTVLEPGDTVLSLDLASGGHLSHLHSSSSYLKFFNHQSYYLMPSPQGFVLDLAELKRKIIKYKPRLLVVGFSAYPKKYEFTEICSLAHDNGCLVLADIAHISGLVATGEHSSPFNPDGSGADFVTTTTHKTLRGPRSALLFAKKQYMPAINKTVFPGTSGGPHLNQIAAVGQALMEVLGEDQYTDKVPFSKYIKSVVANTASLEQGVLSSGITVSAKSETHLSLINLPKASDSLAIQQTLEVSGVITNRNSVPGDLKSAWRPSGLRLGMAALTSRGIGISQSRELGMLIGKAILGDLQSNQLATYTAKLANDLAWPYDNAFKRSL